MKSITKPTILFSFFIAMVICSNCTPVDIDTFILFSESQEASECNDNHLLDDPIFNTVTVRVVVKNKANVLLPGQRVEIMAFKENCRGGRFPLYDKILITDDSGTVNGFFDIEYIYDIDVGEISVRMIDEFLQAKVQRFAMGDNFLQFQVVFESLED